MTVFTNEITTSSGNANKSEDSDEPSVLLSATQAQAQTMQQETATDKSTAPEPPQWRFVSKAKSTEGYHSKFAGSYVRGEHCYHAVPIVYKMMYLFFSVNFLLIYYTFQQMFSLSNHYRVKCRRVGWKIYHPRKSFPSNKSYRKIRYT